MTTSLSSKHCTACEGGMPALNAEQIQNLLSQLAPGWICGAGAHLYKQFKFKNFKAAMAFANKIATIAEEEQHHPNLMIAWGLCGIELYTHAVKGLTENDFILAAKIDNII